MIKKHTCILYTVLYYGYNHKGSNTISNHPKPTLAYRNEVRLEVSEILTHPEYTDPAYSFDQEGPKIYRSDITHFIRGDQRYTGQILLIRPGGTKDIQVRHYSFDQDGPKIYRFDN